MKERTDFYDELLARTDIVKLIESYIPLKKKGASYWGCCPFHHEKTPSFSVSADKQLYHCFGCGEGGNAITFVKTIENAEYSDAVKILAKNANMEIPAQARSIKDSKESVEKRERLFLLLRDAAKKYHQNLMSPAGKHAKEYLSARGIDDKLIIKFGLGYSVNGSDMINHLKSLGYTEKEMKEASVAEISGSGWYDVFYERLIFPIINNFNEVTAFGGRTLIKNPDFAKYRNSSQTAVFDKSKALYGINLLKKRKMKANIDCIIMVEGYMDVIALHKAGFDTAVASMGTALTFNQAKQIKNYCGRVLISYDGDAAGQNATLRSLDILESAGLSVRVVGLPEGLDPDDVIRQKGASVYSGLLKEAKPLAAFKIDTLKNKYDINDIEGKSGFAVEAVKVVKALENPVEREDYLKKISAVTGYSMTALYSQADITVTEKPAAPEAAVNLKESGSAADKIERAKMFILASIADNCAYAGFENGFDDILWNGFETELISFFKENRQKGINNVNILYSVVEEENLKYLDKILNYEFLAGDGADKYRNCVNVLRADYYDKEIKRISKAWQETKDVGLLKLIGELQEKQRNARGGGDSDE